MQYAVESGKMEAENIAAFNKPKANSSDARSPANGFNAIAASAASLIFMFDAKSVEAHATIIKNATKPVTIEPITTSIFVNL